MTPEVWLDLRAHPIHRASRILLQIANLPRWFSTVLPRSHLARRTRSTMCVTLLLWCFLCHGWVGWGTKFFHAVSHRLRCFTFAGSLWL